MGDTATDIPKHVIESIGGNLELIVMGPEKNAYNSYFLRFIPDDEVSKKEKNIIMVFRDFDIK